MARETKLQGNRRKKWTNREIRHKLRCDPVDNNVRFKRQRCTSIRLDHNPNTIFLTNETMGVVFLYLDQNTWLADADIRCSVHV
jgi:hypothetical protein